jgi:hypothetical protein
MSFENDVFISYAHIDDVPLIEGQKGWIANFHRALEVRLAQLLGRTPRIWRDPKLQGNDIFADRLVERLPGVAILVSIISPRYLKSDWCLRELREFIKAANGAGSIRIGHKVRLFKVVKTPVPLDQQAAELQHMLGYEFHTIDEHSGRARELSQGGDADDQRLYWAKLDDLAHDITELLQALDAGGSAAAPSAGPAQIGAMAPRTAAADSTPAAASAEDRIVYLAEATYDLRDKRDAIRRELQALGIRVVPDQPLPPVRPEAEQAIRELLARSELSIHLVGRNYGMIPEGATESIIVMQNELAIERAAAIVFPRLIWIPDALECDDERQVRFLDHLRTDPRIQQGADILQTPFEEFKAAVIRRVERPVVEPPPADAPEGAAPDDGLKRVYLITDRRDEHAPSAIADYLYEQGYEVILPVFDGDEVQIRKDHEENLSICDAVLFYYGEGNELWLRQKLREVQKSAAFGRKKPILLKAIYVAPPDSPTKARFRTREALVIDQRTAFDPAGLGPFISQLH